MVQSHFAFSLSHYLSRFDLIEIQIEIKRVLESLYGFEVEKVQTLNMEGKKKKRGGILLAKPDYKKAYVTLKTPLSFSPDLFPIKVIEEDQKELSKQTKTSFVEESQSKKCHWLEGDRFQAERKPPPRPGGDETAKFPWTSMRNSASSAR